MRVSARSIFQSINRFIEIPLTKPLGGILLALFVMVGTPLFSNYFQKKDDPNPIKLQYRLFGPNNPFSLIDTAWMDIPEQYKSPFSELKAVRTAEYIFENTGDKPIDEKNIKKPLLVTIEKPWVFEKIRTKKCKDCVPVKWKKLDDQTYQMIDNLINAHENFIFDITFSAPGYGYQDKINDPNLDVSFRVEGMDGLKNAETIEKLQKKIIFHREWGISSYQTGWGSIFCLSYIFVLFVFFCFLFEKIWPNRFGQKCKSLILGLYALVCVASSESTSTLVIPSPNYIFNRPPLLENLIPIIINSCIISFMIYKFFSERRSDT